MSMILALRNKQTPNIFRNLILASIQLPKITEVIICSGFFQDNFNKSSYCASTEGRFNSLLAASSATVITVGVHNHMWRAPFDRFNNSLLSKGVNVNPRKVVGNRWHAKVFMLSTINGPILSVIGSSNMTRNAFSTSTPFNYECDVALWVPQAKGVSNIVNQVVSDAMPEDIIRTVYSPSKNSGLTIKSRLTKLREEILTSSIPG